MNDGSAYEEGGLPHFYVTTVSWAGRVMDFQVIFRGDASPPARDAIYE